MLFDEAPPVLVVRKSAISPASRARCLKPCSARPPVAVTFSGFSSLPIFKKGRGKPHHRWGPLTNSAWRGRVTAVRRCHLGPK